MNILMQELAGGIPDLEHLLRAVIRIAVSSILGAVIGIQREHTGKPAGLRTHMLVSMGATLFVLVPVEMGVSIGEVGRVIQGVATGIGFIGGGGGGGRRSGLHRRRRPRDRRGLAHPLGGGPGGAARRGEAEELRALAGGRGSGRSPAQPSHHPHHPLEPFAKLLVGHAKSDPHAMARRRVGCELRRP
jgi:MgtC family